MRFWSLRRSGLLPVSGRGSLRAFVAAVRVCGLPRPFVRRNGDRSSRWLECGFSFFGPDRGLSGDLLFRCWFVSRPLLVRPRR